ncbi:MAG: hypothetical protein JW725_03700 [Candidatus Babeliaceae bacterium]|nr:hypothetical protein [Candidatus Babeliaceae bacterium]
MALIKSLRVFTLALLCNIISAGEKTLLPVNFSFITGTEATFDELKGKLEETVEEDSSLSNYQKSFKAKYLKIDDDTFDTYFPPLEKITKEYNKNNPSTWHNNRIIEMTYQALSKSNGTQKPYLSIASGFEGLIQILCALKNKDLKLYALIANGSPCMGAFGLPNVMSGATGAFKFCANLQKLAQAKLIQEYYPYVDPLYGTASKYAYEISNSWFGSIFSSVSGIDLNQLLNNPKLPLLHSKGTNIICDGGWMEHNYFPAMAWNDPFSPRKISAFLTPYLDPENSDYEKRLKEIIIYLIKFNGDKLLSPEISAHFGFFNKTEVDTENPSVIKTFEESEAYKNNILGLKDKFKKKTLHLRSVAFNEKLGYHENPNAQDEIVKAYVTIQKKWLKIDR